jgi:hypothetical protein
MRKQPMGTDARGYRCGCEPAAVERSAVRTTARRSATKLTVVWPVWYGSGLAGAWGAER